ncbi:GvpL/GvpF family gas vesicle protein [Nocardioides sp.]|uniref:GvpL/GvpF family gas vesicle protein n=1 Tax=Nocardioides sp. TaxID=35761 RepID=UPI002733B550|nr:GvpL/GvpF family gas vesicle protein [Nocardioides sp.]MDP3893124.1 GvpL/GvpF family gas vesicle protein [Nocardioides sp.]
MTTGCFVYAVVEAGARVPDDLSGVDSSPVHVLEHHGSVGAVVGRIELERPPGRRADLLAYNDVIDALAQAGPVVPVRFGTVMEDEQEVEDVLLAANGPFFLDLLGQLAGRAQFNLRATYLEPVVLAEVVAENAEIERLREVTRELPEDAAYAERVRLGELVARALEEKRHWDTTMLLDQVLPRVDAHAVRPGSGVEHLLDVALLVDRTRQDELENHLEGLAEAVHERIRLSLVGPMAAYDFVGGGG